MTPTQLGRAVAVTVALSGLGYALFAASKGWDATVAGLGGYDAATLLPVLALTFVNYGLRGLKWVGFLQRLEVRLSARAHAAVFVAGLGLVITPGKAGELFKPWWVAERTGAPLSRVVPALVAERVTDGLAVALLAAIGVARFAPEHRASVGWLLVLLAAGWLALASKRWGAAVLRTVGATPWLRWAHGPLSEAWTALRTVLTSPGSLALSVALSLVAWGAECVGFLWVLHGVGAAASLDGATFLYAFATLFGAPAPGGLGLADATLVEGATAWLGVPAPQAVAAALIIRLTTLWIGVAIGAIALMFLERLAGPKEP